MLALSVLGFIAAIALSATALSHIGDLQLRLSVLGQRLAHLETLAAGAAPAAPPAASTLVDTPLPSTPPVETDPAMAMATPVPPPTPPNTPPQPKLDWEKHLAEHWLVWLGGVALALGGAFLVKLSIDYGLLVPPVRVALGLTLGIGLIVLGEKAFRQERRKDGDDAKSSTVPQALVASGLVTIFASLYAAYQLYDLISGTLAFPLLAACAGLAVLMSLRHGVFVGALGLVGMFAVPLLVRSTTPHAFALFMYLGVAVAASLVLLRYKAWHWLAWVSLAAPLLWVLLWLATAYTPGDTPVIGGFLIGLLVLFTLFRRGLDAVPILSGPLEHPMVRALLRCCFWAVALLLPVLALVDGFGTASLVCVFIAAGFTLWLAYIDEPLDDLLAAAAPARTGDAGRLGPRNPALAGPTGHRRGAGRGHDPFRHRGADGRDPVRRHRRRGLAPSRPTRPLGGARRRRPSGHPGVGILASAQPHHAALVGPRARPRRRRSRHRLPGRAISPA